MAIFDPSEHTVKDASKLLKGLSDEDLSSVYDSELEGKGRRSLLDAISAARDEIREDAEVASEEEPEVAAPVKLNRTIGVAKSYVRSRGK